MIVCLSELIVITGFSFILLPLPTTDYRGLVSNYKGIVISSEEPDGRGTVF
jgi:hypothetical protein